MGAQEIVLRLIICSFEEKYFKNCNIQIKKYVSVVLLTPLDIGMKEGVTNQIHPKVQPSSLVVSLNTASRGCGTYNLLIQYN